MNVAQPTILGSRALDGWSSVNVLRSPNLALDGHFSSFGGRGENYSHFRGPAPSQPSSYTLQVPSHMPHEVSPDPISRFQNYPGPWVPRGIADLPTYPERVPRQTRSSDPRTRYSEPNTAFSQYQTKAGSELESDITGPYPSDSGYGTRSQATASILSSDPVDHDQDGGPCARFQECPSITDPIDSLNFCSEDPFQVYAQPDPRTRAQSTEHRSDPAQSQTAILQCHYEGCSVVVKCPSEMKYARLSDVLL